MVVAVAVVRVVQATVDEIVDVIAVWNGLVAAAGAMDVTGANGVRRAAHRVGGVDRNRVLVDVITVHVMQMTVMQIIDVALMAHSRVSASRTMLVRMVGVVLFGTSRHHCLPFIEASGSASRRWNARQTTSLSAAPGCVKLRSERSDGARRGTGGGVPIGMADH